MGDVILSNTTGGSERSLASLGFIVELIPNPEIPERDVEKITIPGKNGDAYRDKGDYKEVTRQYRIAAIYGSGLNRIHNYKDAHSKLMSWLRYTGESGLPANVYYELKDTYHGMIYNNGVLVPECIQYARLSGQIELVDLNGQACECVVSFLVNPKKYFNYKEKLILTTHTERIEDPDDPEQTIVIPVIEATAFNPYYADGVDGFANLRVHNSLQTAQISAPIMKVLMKLTPSGDPVDTDFLVPLWSTFIIDSETMSGYADGYGARKPVELNSRLPGTFPIFDGTTCHMEFRFQRYDPEEEKFKYFSNSSCGGYPLGQDGYLEVINKCSRI